MNESTAANTVYEEVVSCPELYCYTCEDGGIYTNETDGNITDLSRKPCHPQPVRQAEIPKVILLQTVTNVLDNWKGGQ